MAGTESAISKSYTYDSIEQLLSESWNTGYSASYTYDSNGNRATRNVNGFLETYSYDAGDKLTSIVSPAGTTTYGYDNAGNTTSIASPAGTKTFTWNEGGRLGSQVTSAGTSNFGYTGLGARTSSSGAVGAATYLLDGMSVVSPVLKDGISTFTPGTSLRTGATSTYSHSGLKNAMSQTASTGTVSATKGYDAFGNAVTSTGTWQGPFAYAGGFGYQTDSTDYKLLGHRYYDPDTGRFLSRDPIKDGRNWYVYGANNPITRTDPTGLGWHAPMVIHVYPDFEGTVIVLGEPGKGRQQGFVIVPPGHHSDPRMDVDYVRITDRSGNQTQYFLMGDWLPIAEATQNSWVTGDGHVVSTGFVCDDGLVNPIGRIWWWRNLAAALTRPIGPEREPILGYRDPPSPNPVTPDLPMYPESSSGGLNRYGGPSRSGGALIYP